MSDATADDAYCETAARRDDPDRWLDVAWDRDPDGADGAPGPRVAASLRVTLRQAVYLAAAQAFARELRLLPRAAGDRRAARRPLVVADTL